MAAVMLVALCFVFGSFTFAKKDYFPAGYKVDCQGYCNKRVTVAQDKANSTADCAYIFEDFADGNATAFSYNPRNKACLIYKWSCCGTKCFIGNGDKQEFIYVKEGQEKIVGKRGCRSAALEDYVDDS